MAQQLPPALLTATCKPFTCNSCDQLAVRKIAGLLAWRQASAGARRQLLLLLLPLALLLPWRCILAQRRCDSLRGLLRMRHFLLLHLACTQHGEQGASVGGPAWQQAAGVPAPHSGQAL